MQEFIGYCLIPSNKGQRMMVIKGNGGETTGKVGFERCTAGKHRPAADSRRLKVAAALRKPLHAAELPRRQAKERSVRQAFDGVKLVPLHPPLRCALRPLSGHAAILRVSQALMILTPSGK